MHPTAPNIELASLSASHDIGLALEIPSVPSRDLTATNKLFEYLRCGLAVVATSTRGQQEVMNQCPEAGWVVPPGKARALAAVLQRCLDNRDEVASAKIAARQAAKDSWNWEHYSGQLATIIMRAANSEGIISL